MDTVLYHLTLEVQQEILERVPYSIMVPENRLEADFLRDWIVRSLQDDVDFDGCSDDQMERIIDAFCDICYTGDGEFVATVDNGLFGDVKERFTIISLFVSPVDLGGEEEEDGGQDTFFELLWETQGVAYSLTERSVMDGLTRVV